MLRRLIVVTALTAGLSVAAVSLATPALAKGPSQASITGPGLARTIVVSGNGEPGMQATLAVLAGQTGLYTAMFGAGVGIPDQPTPLRTSPPKASLGLRYTVTYTVPGVNPQPGEQYGRIRQYLYPDAIGGPVIYTPPGQDGFGGPLQVTGWLRAGRPLTHTLAQLGVPLRPVTSAAPLTRTAHPAAGHRPGSPALVWLASAAVAVAAAALIGLALRLRRRKPAIAPDTDPEPAPQPPGQPTGLR
jgi:hypothetical protein